MQLALNLPLNYGDVVYCALVALSLTFVIISFVAAGRSFKMLKKAAGTSSQSLQQVIDRCYLLFPIDRLTFQGETYVRGTKIRLTTRQNKVFEGEFMGTNQKNMVCIRTDRLIIAHELGNITKIEVLN